jgi:dTDP-4-amino-4,6-dideoxygalactose transaminase
VWEDLLKKITTETEAVYLHFFNGEISETYDFDLLTRLKKKYNFLIIEDTTHSLFSNKRCVGDYCICSLRKWFPIPDGGVLYSPRNLSKIEVPLLVNDWWEDRLQAMFQKADYFQGNTGIKPEFRRRFLACEEKLDNQTIPYKMSEKSLNLLKKYDVCTMIKKRLENSKLLEQYISRCPTLQPVAMVGNSQVPLFFTVLVADRDNLRLRLTQKGIYCAVHWPLYEELRHIEEAVFCNRHELSIPIDQRYGKDEMHYIIQTLNEERIKND